MPPSRRRRCAVPVIAAALAATVAAGCGGASSTRTGTSAPETGGGKDVASLTWAITSSVGSLDPGLVYDGGGNNIVAYEECDPLLRFGENLQLEPGLATSWRQTSKTTYVYRLRDDAKFWDGKPVTAEDVAFSINRIQDKALASPLASLAGAGDLKGAKVTGPSEVTVVLKRANPIAQWLPATPVGQVVEKAAVEQWGRDFGTTPEKVMCSGPYRPTSYTKGAATVLEANPAYWDTAHQPRVQKVTFREVADATAIVAGLRGGDIDGTFDVSARDAATLSGDPSLRVDVNAGTQINYVSPNLLKGPFKNPDVRRAFSLAVDRTGLATAIDGDSGQPLKGPVTPGLATYELPTFDAGYKALPLSVHPQLEEAKQVIAKAGASGQTVQIAVLSGGTSDTVGAALQQAGESIGLNVEIVKLPAADFFAESQSGKLPRRYDALLNFWGPDVPDPSAELVPPFGSRFSNVEGFHDPAYDALREQWANSKNGSAEQAKALVAMETMLIEKTVKIPLTVGPLVQIHRASIGGYTQTKLYYYQPFLLDVSGG